MSVCLCVCTTYLSQYSKFYHYSVSNDGVKETHGDDYEKDYFTDVIKREAVQFIKDATEPDDNKDDDDTTPFFMYIATPAPHRPATPAPQYEHSYDNHSAPRTPSYNYNSTDKHWIISEGERSNRVFYGDNM